MRCELSSFLLLHHGLRPCLSAKMDSYASGRASQNKSSLSHKLFLVMVFYHSDSKVTGTLTRGMVSFCATAEDPVLEKDLCVSFLKILLFLGPFLQSTSFPAVSSSALLSLSDHPNPFASLFQRPRGSASPCLLPQHHAVSTWDFLSPSHTTGLRSAACFLNSVNNGPFYRCSGFTVSNECRTNSLAS